FSDLFEMHFIELSKFKKEYSEIKTALDRWSAFLCRAYEMEKGKIPKEIEVDESVKKAIEKLDTMYLEKEEREIYENERKAMMIRKAEVKTAEIKGRKEGEYKKSIEIAKNLLDVLDNETIAIKTGLSVEEVNKLRE
ncbi:Rpn family recombination-promoting nuclease/putative transposase, partial [Tepidibacter thalassicus]